MWPKWLRLLVGGWVAYDSNRRQGMSVFWTGVVIVLGPLLLPFYLASRPLISGEIRKGSFVWNAFWNFEALISALLAIAATVVAAENFMESSRSDLAVVKRAEIQAGTIFGFLVGVVLFLLGRVGISIVRSQLED